MRYAVFSDIHSNLEALEAVLEALRAEEADRYFCVGDIVGYAADPKACIKMIRELNCLTVCGNHDWAAVDLIDYSYFNVYARASVDWTKTQLDDSERDYLKGLPLKYEDEEITLVHGSLKRPEEFDYIFGEDDASRTLDLCRTKICFVGHTHSPAKFTEGSKRLVNVGSVGQPRDNDPRAAYCIYDTDTGTVEIKRVKYDIRKAMNKILGAGLPEPLAYRLLEGS
ncbi:MAG: metallophosphoesterase family protein [Candidatus Omnitrophota bacterium]|nr:metallophosphoesterase family protein [Candidatus Omnitrophota bacterium]